MLTTQPVTAVDFEAVECQCSNRISWTALSEFTSFAFKVERSRDLQNWRRLCLIHAEENDGSAAHYSCVDERASELNSKLYYRLIHIDTEGREEVQGVRVVENYDCEGLVFQMSPNPTCGKSTIVSKFHVEVELVDMSGMIIKKISLKEGVNEMDFTFLAPGFYTIMTDIGSGGRGYSFRFIKY